MLLGWLQKGGQGGKTAGWACPACTFHNGAAAARCAMCDGARVVNKRGGEASAATAPPAKKKKKTKKNQTSGKSQGVPPPACPANQAVVDVFEKLSASCLLAEKVDAEGKSEAYRNAARALSAALFVVSLENATELGPGGRMKLPGFGKACHAKLLEFLRTRTVRKLDEYTAQAAAAELPAATMALQSQSGDAARADAGDACAKQQPALAPSLPATPLPLPLPQQRQRQQRPQTEQQAAGPERALQPKRRAGARSAAAPRRLQYQLWRGGGHSEAAECAARSVPSARRPSPRHARARVWCH